MPVERTRALRRQILRPHQTEDELASHEPAQAHAVGSFEGDELVAVGLIGPQGEPGEWRVRGMATAPAVRGQGHGSAVLAALLEHARAHGAAAVWAQVRTPARRLYERAGFHADSEEFDLPRIGPHLLMRLRLGGSASHGSASHGSASHGSASHGSASDGSASDGSASDGSASDGPL